MEPTATRLLLIGALFATLGCDGTNTSPPPQKPATPTAPTDPAGPIADPAKAAALVPAAPAPADKLSNIDSFVVERPGGNTAAATPQPQIEEVPMTLTGSDGTGLTLVSLDAKAVVEGPLAFTELKLTFKNPENRRREGRFAITLPASASISRFAMKIHGAWMEGEVVEKQRARRIYEDFLHRRQDPAILEQDAGNTFRARVFPIEANESKELIVSYSHTLTDKSSAYTLPLRGLPKLDQLAIRAYVHGGGGEEQAAASMGGTVGSVKVLKVDKQDFAPGEDFEVYPSFLKQPHDGLRSGNIALARLEVTSKVPGDGFARVAVLVDTSASQAPSFEKRLERLSQLMAFLGKAGATQVSVTAFDQSTQSIYEGTPGGFGEAQLDALRQRGALGASDLGAALVQVGKQLSGGADARLVIMSNGVATAGLREADALRAAVAELGLGRVDTITTTTARDDGLLEALVTAEGPRAGINLLLRDRDEELGRLALATFAPIDVKVPGAKWVWPKTIKGLQPGQARLVYADLPEDKAFQIELTGGTTLALTPNVAEAAKPLLERAWVGARIKLLEHRSAEGDPDLRAAFRQQAIKLSVDKRVLSPWTALLVLERESDYARYGIDRKALADILTVSADGVAVAQARTGATPPPIAPRPPPRPREPTKGLQNRANGRTGTAPSPGASPTDERSNFNGGGEAAGAADDEAEPMEEADAMAEPAAQPALLAPEAKPMRAAKSAPRMRPASSAGAKVSEKPEAAKRPASGCRDQLLVKLRSVRPALERCRVEHAPATPTLLLRWEIELTAAGKIKATWRSGDAPDALKQCVGRALEKMSPAGLDAGCKSVLLVPLAAPRAPGPPTDDTPGAVDATGARELKAIQAGREATPALTGQLADLQQLLDEGKITDALKAARTWRAKSPTDVLALVALGRALTADGRPDQAARAYGSLLDLYPSRADLRRFAGNLLESIGPGQLALATDTYRVAVEQRADHPSGYHMLAMALAQAGEYGDALDTLKKGLAAPNRSGNFPGVRAILRDDLSLIATVWAAKEPARRAELTKRLGGHSVKLLDGTDLRFILTWETDANDVDFHIFDAQSAHAYYSRKALGSGGRLYDDVTRGYGPECFAIPNAKAHPYRLFANYYSKGPMGYGMGRLQVIRSDGDGRLDIESRPFVIMNDRAWVDMGTVKGG